MIFKCLTVRCDGILMVSMVSNGFDGFLSCLLRALLMVLMILNVVLEKIPRICGVIGSTSNDSSNGSVSVSNRELPLFTHGPMAMSLGKSIPGIHSLQFPSVRRRDVRSLWFTQKDWGGILSFHGSLSSKICYFLRFRFHFQRHQFFQTREIFFLRHGKMKSTAFVLRLEIADTIGLKSKSIQVAQLGSILFIYIYV